MAVAVATTVLDELPELGTEDAAARVSEELTELPITPSIEALLAGRS